MPSKFPCCGDCGTRLMHVYSGKKSSDDYQMREYYCKKCDNEITRIKIRIHASGKKYHEKKLELIFSELERK